MLTNWSAGTYRPFRHPGALFMMFYDRQGCQPSPRQFLIFDLCVQNAQVARKRLPIGSAPAQELERPQLLAAELGRLQRKGFVFFVNLL